jgi:4-amino-4-deoxy-L-arabinose transferase-like glycosyltransferase
MWPPMIGERARPCTGREGRPQARVSRSKGARAYVCIPVLGKASGVNIPPVPAFLRFRRDWVACALALCALVWFCGLEFRGLFAPDEGRYADIAREMLQSGDWVTPRLNGLKYFEKPPLQYWATAAIFALFGVDEWTARLWPALTGFLGILFAAFAGSRLAPRSSPASTALIFAGSWGYFLGAQFLTLDMGLTFFLSVALLAFLLGRRAGIAPGAERGWTLLAWGAMGLAVLSKGLVGAVLPAIALAAYVAVERDWTLPRRLHCTRGLALFAVIVLPWFVLVQLRKPEFSRFFFVHEHFERYLLPYHHRPGPWWYFIPVLLLGLLPWTVGIPAAIANGWKAREPGFKFDRFLIIWAVVVVVFFSASQSKLPGYVLPAFPALLLLFARHGSEASTRARAAPVLVSLLACVVLALLGAVLSVERVSALVPGMNGGYAVWLLGAGLVLCATALAARRHETVTFVGLGSLLALQLALSGTHLLDARFSSERFIEAFVGEGKQFPRNPPFYSVATYDHSVPFYLGRPVTLVGHKDELGPGIASEPDKYVGSIDEFMARWNRDTDAFAIMTPSVYEKLRTEGLPSRVVARDARRVIIARH